MVTRNKAASRIVSNKRSCAESLNSTAVQATKRPRKSPYQTKKPVFQKFAKVDPRSAADLSSDSETINRKSLKSLQRFINGIFNP